jgi:hypothetical protein
MIENTQLQNELSQATCDLINTVVFASKWQGQAVQLRDRIERALHVLRNACDESDDSFDGWDLVRQGIKILEGREK